VFALPKQELQDLDPHSVTKNVFQIQKWVGWGKVLFPLQENYQLHAYQKISTVTTTVEMPTSNW